MKTYQCHKKVEAFQIASTIEDAARFGKVLLRSANGEDAVEVNDAWVNRHNPKIGGYVVIYSDGYKSYSPQEVFESGYTVIEDDATD